MTRLLKVASTLGLVLLLQGACPNKPVLNLQEPILLLGKAKVRLTALVDTGADYSSMDTGLAQQLGYRKVVKHITVQTANGESKRPLVQIPFILKGKKKTVLFSLISRQHMKHKAIIGRNALKGFLVDPHG